MTKENAVNSFAHADQRRCCDDVPKSCIVCTTIRLGRMRPASTPPTQAKEPPHLANHAFPGKPIPHSYRYPFLVPYRDRMIPRQKNSNIPRMSMLHELARYLVSADARPISSCGSPLCGQPLTHGWNRAEWAGGHKGYLQEPRRCSMPCRFCTRKSYMYMGWGTVFGRTEVY